REYRVISALGDTDVPVPKTYCLCTDESIIGTWFYVMDCVEGRIFWDLTLPTLEPDERQAIYQSTNQAMASLHQVDFSAVGLDGFGKTQDYVARQISRWSGQYLESTHDRIEELDKLIDWLKSNIPDTDECGIVHGDYRLDNMIVHPTEPKIVAILDWELATLGDPLADFSYHCMSWRIDQGERGILGKVSDADKTRLGIPTEEEYVAQYCANTGRGSMPNWEFYMIYNLFKLSAILHGILGRSKAGTAASEHAADTGKEAYSLAKQGWSLVQKIG
ncbi:MAG: phosphotransferase, partial [Pseudomonadota bacterium]